MDFVKLYKPNAKILSKVGQSKPKTKRKGKNGGLRPAADPESSSSDGGSVNSWDRIQEEFNDIVDSTGKDDKGGEYKRKSRNISVCIIIPILAVISYSCYHIYQGHISHRQSRANHNLVGSSQQFSKAVEGLNAEMLWTMMYIYGNLDYPVVVVSDLRIKSNESLAEISSWPKTLETNYATKTQFVHDLEQLRGQIDAQQLRAEEAFKAYHVMIKIIYEGVIQSLQGGSFSLVWNTLVTYETIIFSRYQLFLIESVGVMYFMNGTISLDIHSLFIGALKLHDYSLQFSQIYGGDTIRSKIYQSLIKYSGDLRTLLKQIRGNAHVEQSHKIALFWINIGMSYDEHIKSIQDSVAASVNEKMASMIKKAILYQYATEVVLIILCLILSVFAVIDIRKIKQIYLYLKSQSERTKVTMRVLKIQKDKSEALLFRMLPYSVVRELRKCRETSNLYVGSYQSATVLFADLADFQRLAARDMSPFAYVRFLETFYSRISEVLESHNVNEIETAAGECLVVSGLPDRIPKHCSEIALTALGLRSVMCRGLQLGVHGDFVCFRLIQGIATGPAAAGIIGVKLPRFCVFGDTVNTAARMKSTAIGMRIQITDVCSEVLEEEFIVSKRGVIFVKGKGEMETHWLIGVRNSNEDLTNYNSSNSNSGSKMASNANRKKRNSWAEQPKEQPKSNGREQTDDTKSKNKPKTGRTNGGVNGR
ncbi:uncharacterized protein LOC134826715 [Bolinopsis microptera]|uniref:uncharacterized protein LOC134826715 n=1 Tax=Bolinopsis microptera TaxID=2820187 RepID=UPI003079B547